MGVGQIIFLILLLAVAFLGYRLYSKVYHRIYLGKAEAISGPTSLRWKNVLLVALGQKKMFKRWIPALMHFFIYAAFLLTQVELIEILVDGLTGGHRSFVHALGWMYPAAIGMVELLTMLAFIGTTIFLIRRNILKIGRFQKPEMKGWPKLDANLILIGEMLLILGIICMNGADFVLQQIQPEVYHKVALMPMSSWLGPALFGGMDVSTLHMFERFGWWLHIIVVFGFILYLPMSKHLHIFLAFPNTFFSRLKPKGEMQNMPEIMNEVKSMMDPEAEMDEMSMEEELPEFGASDVFDMTRIDLLGAYTCTECGRCTSVCPANITGKKLSPRKIMMDLRDRAQEVGDKIESGNQEFAKDPDQPLSRKNFDDGKNLFDYITREEIHACTTCQSCIEACPVLINPMEPILKMRRYEILTESQGPAEWLPMFNAIENTGAVWSMPQERDAWTKEL